MNIGEAQKKIIRISRYLYNRSNKNFIARSPQTYFALWGKTIGFERIKYKLHGLSHLIPYFLIIFKDIFSISLLSDFKIYKNNRLKKIKYKNLIVSNANFSDFNTNGSYTDRYFRFNSKKHINNIYFLFYMSEILPNKIDKNIILLVCRQTKFRYNFFFLLKYILCKLIKSKFSVNFFLNSTSTYNRISEVALSFLKKEVNLKKIYKIIVPYEGQIFQNQLFYYAKKINKNIINIGYEHSAPHTIPLNLMHSSLSPDILFVNGKSQIKFLNKFLAWPQKKLKLVPSARYPKNLDLGFENTIFLPYEIFNQEIIIKEFENLIINSPINTFNFFKIKSHPMAINSKKQNLIKLKLENIIKRNKNRFDKKKVKNTAIFIGPTTGAIVALEKKIKVIHICFDPIFDSYSSALWPNLKVVPLSKNTFIYTVKKINTFIKFSKYKNCYEKYYDI